MYLWEELWGHLHNAYNNAVFHSFIMYYDPFLFLLLTKVHVCCEVCLCGQYT